MTHDYGAAHGHFHAAQLFGAALDGDLPRLFAFALAFYQANSRFHDGEQEQIQQRDEKQPAYQEDDVDHVGAPNVTRR